MGTVEFLCQIAHRPWLPVIPNICSQRILRNSRCHLMQYQLNNSQFTAIATTRKILKSHNKRPIINYFHNNSNNNSSPIISSSSNNQHRHCWWQVAHQWLNLSKQLQGMYQQQEGVWLLRALVSQALNLLPLSLLPFLSPFHLCLLQQMTLSNSNNSLSCNSNSRHRLRFHLRLRLVIKLPQSPQMK